MKKYLEYYFFVLPLPQMLGLLNILLVAFPLFFGSVSVADEPQNDSYECCDLCNRASGNRSIEADANCSCDYSLRVRTVANESSDQVRNAVHTVNYTYKKIQSNAPATFAVTKCGNSFNSNTWDDYLERLSKHTSGMRASVDRLFTLGSVRL